MTDYSNIPECFYRIGVKALICDENGRFLLWREDNGKWELPGGGLELDESPQEGLRRELKEEAGLEAVEIAEHPSYFTRSMNTRLGYPMAHIMYKTRVKNLNITPSDECQEVRFFTIEEALEAEVFPSVIEFCKQYKI